MSEGWAAYEADKSDARRKAVVKMIMARFALGADDSFLVQSQSGNRVLKVSHLVEEIVKVAEESLA